jgi:hypothetical protein
VLNAIALDLGIDISGQSISDAFQEIMTNRRINEAQNSLAALIELAFTGSLREWGAVLIAIAVPLILSLQLMALFSSLISDVITPLILSPILRAANISHLENLVIGEMKIGVFSMHMIGFTTIAIALFVITRLTRRWF